MAPDGQDAKEQWIRQRLLSEHHQRCTRRRQEHLATLGLPIAGASVLEVGGGVGEHLGFFVDRDCRVLTTDARDDLLAIARERFPGLRTRMLDLDDPPPSLGETFDVVYCAGVIYQLTRPAEALEFLARHTGRLLFLQSVVTPGDGDALHPITDPGRGIPMTASGLGCKPTRAWLFRELGRHFPHVYVPATQPYHEDYPVDWTLPPPSGNACANFIAAREPLPDDHGVLLRHLPVHQTRR